MKKLIILAGLPCSGKSTYIDNLKKNGEEFKVVSRDNMLIEYGKNKYGLKKYNDIWSNLTKEDQDEINKLLDKRIKELAEKDGVVVVDMTMLTKIVRKNMMDSFKGFDVEIVSFVVSFPVILERNIKRSEETGKLIPEQVLRDMFARYELPSEEEDSRVTKVEFLIHS